MGLESVLWEILQRPTVWDVMIDLFVFTIPLWVAVSVGVLVGWSWKPKWANLPADGLDSNISSISSSFGSFPSLNSLKLQFPWLSDAPPLVNESSSSSLTPPSFDDSASQVGRGKPCVVMEDELRHLYRLVEEKDDGPAWIQMMDQSATRMHYQAWRRDSGNGLPQYRSRTVYEDISPEMVRDFFWDDEFRLKWDDMILHAQVLEESPSNGSMVVHWVRKFPFFCSDREYIIGRRIWESEGTYYCVTKGVPCLTIPRRNKPRRVDIYYSSWCIRAVESKISGRTACEVVLFHHEDMGIPWEIAKLGVRQGMWGAVKKIDRGLRLYQQEREASNGPTTNVISRCAYLAGITTKVDSYYLTALQNSIGGSMEIETADSSEKKKAVGRNNIPKYLMVGGAIALACSLDRGLLTKAVIFGVGRRFARIGKR